MWYRVFAAAEAAGEPAEVLEHLGPDVRGHFRGDDQGWFEADLELRGAAVVRVERYRADEDGIRDELNTWAAWLETREDNRHHGWLMQHVVGARQVFTIQRYEDDEEVEALCLALCRYLAGRAGGVYQADGRGFFSAGGELLVDEA